MCRWMGRSRWLGSRRVGSRSGRAAHVSSPGLHWRNRLQLYGRVAESSRSLGLLVVLWRRTVRVWICHLSCVLRRHFVLGAPLLGSSLGCRVSLVFMLIIGGVLPWMRGGLTVPRSTTSALARIACDAVLCVSTLSRMRFLNVLHQKRSVRPLARSGSRRGWSGRRVTRCRILLLCSVRRCVTVGARLGRSRSLCA